MQLFEISEKYRISMPKLRKLAKDGLLRVDQSDDVMSSEIYASLSNGHALSAVQLHAIIKRPEILQELRRYTNRAKAQVDALGTPIAAPNAVTADLAEMAGGDMIAVGRLVDWLKEILPAKPVSHQWIAVRLLLGVPEALHKYEAGRIPRVMLNARKHPAFAGWFTVDLTKGNGKTFYARPDVTALRANNTLDL